MIYTIENEHLKVQINDMGAEMVSIFGKKNNFEYLWQGDPTYWTGHAYVLFPICGRLTQNKYTYEGKTYEMNLHGFSRKSTHKVVKQTKTSIEFELTDNENTLNQYPFNFIFRISYSLDGAKVRTNLYVENTGKKDLPFSLGGHPGFNLPLENGLKAEDHYVDFGKTKNLQYQICSPEKYCTGKTADFPLEDDRILRFKHSLFDNDAIFLDNIPSSVVLKSDKTDRFVKVSYKDMTHLGLWHAPQTEAPYICIEPWHGIPAIQDVIDDFDTKRDMMHLKPNSSYSSYIDIEVNE